MRASSTHMKTASLSALFARIDAAEYGLCRRLNRGASHVGLRNTFRVASRLGDGVIWYAMLALLPLLYGRAAARPAVLMAITGAVGSLLYKVLKKVCVRERRFISPCSISPAAPPLDRYSFPSGHTLHAVAFAWQAIAA